MTPSWLVDAAIYSEMKGGLHPWFTGLAVVGGVYVFGAVGAVYGPLALCVVYVLVNMYTTFMQEGLDSNRIPMVSSFTLTYMVRYLPYYSQYPGTVNSMNR